MSQKFNVDCDLGDHNLNIHTGHLAKQADGSVTVRCGDTIVLVTACAAPDPKEGIDFLPLTVDYQERTFAAGKIPGGFFKREGRPTEKETLTSRFIDRPLRPLFPDGWNCETQVIATVLSVDPNLDPDVLAITGASAALTISDIPFNGPIAGCRIGRVNGKLIINPTFEELEKSDLEIILAASEDAIVMVEGGGWEIPEAEMWEALQFGHEAIKPVVRAQKDLAKQMGTTKREVQAPEPDEALEKKIRELSLSKLQKAFQIPDKLERTSVLREIKKALLEEIVSEDDEEDKSAHVASLFKKVESDVVREK
ncbi:MAG: polyribonucleotide nucleotidyltransferase, partial [bacterium]|nr:polyribonucleotide nucleotidyltransferase [bacterium]